MTPHEYDLFLQAAMGICALIIVINLVRAGSRGVSAYMLAGAAATAGVLLFCLQRQAPQALIAMLGVIAVALIVGDFLLRAKKEHGKP